MKLLFVGLCILLALWAGYELYAWLEVAFKETFKKGDEEDDA